MLSFKTSKIIDFAHNLLDSQTINKLLFNFLDHRSPTDYSEPEKLSGFFSEWLIFEHNYNDDNNIFNLYYLKNPDNLSEKQLNDIKQVIETQKYELLEVVEVESGKYIKAYGLSTGKIYKIHEKLGSKSMKVGYTFPGRVAKINNKYYLVGTDTIILPISFNQKTKAMLKNNDEDIFSIKDTIAYLVINKTEPLPRYTMKEVKNKRKKLTTKYNKIAKKYKVAITVEEIIESIKIENYGDNTTDWTTDLMKLGIPFIILEKYVKLFQDFWKYLKSM